MIDKVKLWIEKFGEAWTACIICMVQGDLTVVSMKHAMIAAKTGTLTGLAFVIVTFLPWNNKWLAIFLTGLFTAIADSLIHMEMFPYEAIVTGFVAALIALAYEYFKGKRNEQ